MWEEIFIKMVPPTVTHQEKRWRCIKGKPVCYEGESLKKARAQIREGLALFAQRVRVGYIGPCELVVKWCFPCVRGKKNGSYKASKPDTDNLQKLLKDEMTALGFWRDDCLVASEIVQKFYAETPGIYIAIRGLDDEE